MPSVWPRFMFTVADEWTRRALRATYNVLLIAPLHTLYFHGPFLHGYGFWAGTPPEDMCAALMPGTSALFWITHVDECAAVLDKRFHAFLTAILVCGYVGLLYKLVTGACFYLFVVRPFLARRLTCQHHRREHLKQQASDTESEDGGGNDVCKFATVQRL